MERDLSQLRIDPTRRERKGPGKIIIVGIISVAVLAVVIALIAVFAKRAPEVETAAVREAGAAQAAVLNASGYVTPRRRATVSAKVTGKIRDVLIDEGMVVEAGQVLARLDDVDAVASLRATEAEKAVAIAALQDLEVRLASARRTLVRSKDLRARDLVSEQELEDAETAVASFEAQIALARESIEAAERRSQSPGRTSRTASSGRPSPASSSRRTLSRVKWFPPFRREADTRVPGSRRSSIWHRSRSRSM
jgi:multidrug efflux pump subunit AcrA (membrane-fusion protein)